MTKDEENIMKEAIDDLLMDAGIGFAGMWGFTTTPPEDKKIEFAQRFLTGVCRLTLRSNDVEDMVTSHIPGTVQRLDRIIAAYHRTVKR